MVWGPKRFTSVLRVEKNVSVIRFNKSHRLLGMSTDYTVPLSSFLGLKVDTVRRNLPQAQSPHLIYRAGSKTQG